MAGALARGRAAQDPDRSGEAEVLRAGHVPLPVGRGPARRPLRGLHGDRRHHALEADAGVPRAAPDGLGRVRPAGRELRHQARRPPARHDRRSDRQLPPPDRRGRLRLRLGARDQHHRSRRTCSGRSGSSCKLYERDLAYEAVVPINWCPSCKTGLANEEVSQGRCERCGTRRRAQGHAPVDAAHHALRRSAARGSGRARLAGVDGGDAAQLDRPQRGRRGDVHDGDAGRGPRAARVHDAARHAVRRDVHGAVARARAGRRADDAGAARGGRGVPGRRRGARATSSAPIWPRRRPACSPARRATNPVNGKQIPIWIADYVLASYGTGAIMAVPAHDERDFEFAKKFGIPIVAGRARRRPAARARSGRSRSPATASTSTRGRSTGCRRPRRRRRSPRELEARGVGKGAVSYRLRDWVFSRQRYWGEPIPLVHCPKDGVVPVPEAQLPVRLPDVERYEPTGTGESPLAAIDSFVNTTCPKCGGPAKRETNTMPQWAGSCWYYLRYLDPKNDDARVRSGDREAVDAGRPLRRRRRARRAAPALRALLAQGALRHRRRQHEGAVPEAAPPGHGARVLVRGRDGALPRARRGRAARRRGVPEGDRREAEGRPSRRWRSRR